VAVSVQRELVSRPQSRRCGPVLGAGTKVAGAEDDGSERSNVLRVQRPLPASLTSTSSPLGTCTPRRLAGMVAASLAITRSPGRRHSIMRGGRRVEFRRARRRSTALHRPALQG